MNKRNLTLKDFQDDAQLYARYIKGKSVMRALDSKNPMPFSKISDTTDKLISFTKHIQSDKQKESNLIERRK